MDFQANSVNYFFLSIALILPWLTGILMLSSLSKLTGSNNTWQIGYGFFTGYLLLYIIINASVNLTGSLQAALVSVALVSILLIALLINCIHTPWQQLNNPTNPSKTYNIREKCIIIVLLILIVVHLTFGFIETLLIPLFPWDAFSTWAYAAKVWAHTGSIAGFVTPTQWLAQPEASAYTSYANNYPTFSSLMQLWAATSFGQWSETLINLPQFLCVVAIGLALFAECRNQGANLLASLATTYIFISIPLLNNHLALGGYADVWLAGFTGLGFVKLMTGLKSNNIAAIISGFILIAAGILIKNEGVVWLILAILMTTLYMLNSRTLLAIFSIITSCIIFLIIFNITYIDLGSIGKIGYLNGKIFMPNMPGIAFEYHDVWLAYWKNFFLMGSWNILWGLLIASSIAALIPPYTPTQKLTIIFLLVFFAGQFFIFFLTDQGRWAKQYTSINRLPLQFAPALIYACFLIWSNYFKSKLRLPSTNIQINETVLTSTNEVGNSSTKSS